MLNAHGLEVGHEEIGPDGIVSWMQVAMRREGPWGVTLPEYPEGTKLFLAARSPLASLNSVATENQQIRSIGFRSQLIWERRGIDLFAQTEQTAGEGIYDFFGWAVMSLAYWYGICLDENPATIFRVDKPGDEEALSELVGRRISRDGKDVWRNEYGPHKKSGRLDYPMTELARVSKAHLNSLIEVANTLGYPEDAAALAEYI